MNVMETQKQHVAEAAAYIRERLPQAEIGIVLGSGLSALAQMMAERRSLSYGEIPHFPQPTVIGHNGEFIYGQVGDKGVYALSGRFHYYEGNDPYDVVLGVRTLRELGCHTIILTNAAGGIDLSFSAGDLMLITDHINFTGYNPLRGPNCDDWGTRFPDMSCAYDPALRELAQSVAHEQGFSLREGVYCGLAGPNFETPAEIRMLRGWGAQACGMSTVPEVLAARHMGLRVLAVSCITNLAAGVSPTPLTHEEVFAAGKQAEQRFSALMAEIIRRM